MISFYDRLELLLLELAFSVLFLELLVISFGKECRDRFVVDRVGENAKMD